MTGQIVSRRDLAAAISFTWVRTRASMTAKTSSTDRPEAAIRVRRAAFIWRIAALRSAGGLSQCGSGGNEAAWGVLVAVTARPLQRSGLLERTLICAQLVRVLSGQSRPGASHPPIG